jgi:uncharacterized protein
MIHWLMNAILASMVFYPIPEYGALPQDFGLRQEDAWPLTEDGVKIHGWFFQAPNATTSLLFLHGNATNISGVLPYAKAWVDRGVSTLLLDYRAYAQSEGSIKKGSDIFLDAEAGVKWLEEKGFKRDQIILWGQSIGSAPATELAQHNKYKALVLESPLNSLKALAKLHYGIAPGFIFKDFPFENEEKIGAIQCPLFILHGTKDDVCPFWMGQKLFDAARGRKEMLAIEGANHNNADSLAGDDFFEKPYRFIFSSESS